MARNSQAVIANGAALSGAIDLGDRDRITAIQIPAAWTAAAITFAADVDGTGTFQPVYDEAGTELTIASANVVASRYVLLGATTFLCLTGLIKIRSGTSAAPVNQGAARTLGIAIGTRVV